MESNGLLGVLERPMTVQAPATFELHREEDASPQPSPLTLSSNGLLGSMMTMMDDHDDQQTWASAGNDEEMPLTSNGLLTSMDDGPTPRTVDNHPPTPTLLNSNGLLGSPTASSSRQTQPAATAAIDAASSNHSTRKSTFEAVLGDGRSIFLRRRTRHRSPENDTPLAPPAVHEPLPANNQAHHLLDTPVWKLRDAYRLEADERLAKTLAEKENMRPRQPAQVFKGKGKEQMWVDKYRPTKFTELLGEEEWDRCVFNVRPPVNVSSRKRAFGGAATDAESSTFAPLDPLGRPRDRILLLSGPPGLGKTTLAHVVARHAGYDVLEVNASDDRNAATVEGRIRDAIEAGSGLRSRGKPTCVIVDEVDGAAGGSEHGFVRSLVKLAQDVPARKRGDSVTPPKLLRRPIICICNDLYAPALRPLRQIARIVRFRKAQPLLVVNRLRDVCRRESIDMPDARALNALVEITNADVRSCLNTLQFVASKAIGSAVTEKVIREAAMGAKETGGGGGGGGASLQAIWHDLFVPPTTNRNKQRLGAETGKFVNRLAFAIQAAGDMDKIAQGCFEHYPNLKPIDTSLGNLIKIHDWLHFFDSLSGRVGRHQEFELMAYMPYGVVPWYTHMAAPANNGRPAEYPKADFDCYQQTTVNKEIADALAASLPPTLRGLYTPDHVLIELAPVLMRIISPNLKPMNANLVKQEEKATLARLVQIMIDLGLRFVRDKTEDGQPTFKLEPPIDVFIHYDGKRAGDVATARYAVRQLVSQAVSPGAQSEGAKLMGGGTWQIDAELARRNGAATKDVLGGANIKKQDPNDPDKPPVDFFGRLIEVESATSSSVVQRPAKKFRVIYRFNEGSSSAVRKPIKMSSLM